VSDTKHRTAKKTTTLTALNATLAAMLLREPALVRFKIFEVEIDFKFFMTLSIAFRKWG
jgi:hypothetical protein